MRLTLFIALSLFLFGTGLAFAHADYKSSDPPKGVILKTAPTTVILNFTESLETRFSIFKVYPLEGVSAKSVDPQTTQAASPTVTDAEGSGAVDYTPIDARELLRLNGLAGSLVNEVLSQRGDEAVRVDAGVVTADAQTDEVVVDLKPDLAPGTYVVMWRVLGTDTHTTQGYFIFQLASEP